MYPQYELKELDGTNGKIYLGIPRERVYLTPFVDNRDTLLFYLQNSERGAGYFQADGHRVDRNRDKIVEDFLQLEKKPEWLVQIDSDMEHARDAPMRLVRHNLPVVGGLYFHRGERHDPFVFNRAGMHQDKYGRFRMEWHPMREEVYQFLIENNVPMRDGSFAVEGVEKPLLECDAVATGCLAIHRSVLELMEPPWFEYQVYGSSEDLTFCDIAKYKYGVPINCDLSTISGHYNWVPMGQAQFRTLFEGWGINLTTYTKRMAAEWLHGFFGTNFDDAVVQIEKGSAHVVGDYYTKRFKKRAIEDVSQEELTAFYASEKVGQLYVIELLHWNFGMNFNQLRKVLMPVREAKVLEIGSGIGTVAMQLAFQKCDVVASELNETLREFSKYRWNWLIESRKRSDYGDLFITDNHEWKGLAQDNQFDLVVCFDTFEHIPKTELIELMQDLYRVLPVGGRLVYHANWEQQDIFPMHFDHSDWWLANLEELGFMQIGTFEAIKVR